MTRGGGASVADRELVDIQSLSVRIPGRERPIFEGLSLSVSPGEVVVIAGGSGVGKSTLAELLFDLRPELEVEGDLRHDPSATLLLQQGAVFDDLSVGENLSVVLRRHGRRADRATVRGYLREVNLEGLDLSTPAHALSGGQRRRLALARALAVEPRLLCFDEPSAGLDIDNVRDQAMLIRRLCRGGRGAVVVTHDVRLSALAGDRILLLVGGGLEPVCRFEGAPLKSEVGEGAAAWDEAEVVRRQETIAKALTGRLGVDLSPPPSGAKRVRARMAAVGRAIVGGLLLPGDLLLEILHSIVRLPMSARHPSDLMRTGGRSFWSAGLSGFLFYGTVAAVLGAILMVVLKLASPLPFERALELMQGTMLSALTPPLMGFLFGARSGSAVVAWLGGMRYSRQVDAMQSLAIDPDSYLRAPVWLGASLAFVATSAVFLVCMWIGSAFVARVFMGAPDAFHILAPRLSDAEMRDAIVKTPIYAVMLGAVATHWGLKPKPTAEHVARAITRAIIAATVLVTLSELIARIPGLVS